MWYVLTTILAIIGSFVAWSGEPMGAIGFIPMIASMVLCEFKQPTDKKNDVESL